MMNQGVNIETISSVDSNSLETRYAVDASQSHAASYFPPTTAPEAASWTMHRVDNHSAENGIPSNATFHHDQPADPSTRNVQLGLNSTSLTSSSTSEVASTSQDYSSYASYSNATDPYGYASTGYSGYYSGYQQQPNHSYSQQQPSHAYSQQQQQQQQPPPNHAYSQQQQPNHVYSQQQPNQSYTQQQPNHAYSQPLGAYQNTGAPYQPLSSFQNTGSYAGTSSYSATYYNPGDYQTSGAYPSSGYGNQTALWNDSNYANYTTQQYSNYASDTTSAYSSGTAAATSVNYQQHYKQWADYYNQTEVTCAPGTEHLSASSASNQGTSAIGGVTAGYPSSNCQPSSSYTPSWIPESTSSELHSVQGGATTGSAYDSYWKQGALSFQNHHASPMQPHFQKSLDSTTYDNFQEQQKTVPQGTNSQYPAAHQVPHNYQPSVQTVPSLDTRRVSKLQIPTNPRIASNLALGLSKTDKDGSTTSPAVKPAYIAVSMPKANDKVLPNDSADSMFKPGSFPNSLRFYVERALKRCHEHCENDPQTKACLAVMKEIITKATADGTLHTRDWDTEPLFPLPNPDFADKESSQSSTPVASLPKYKRSPSRRSKSRWEPLPEEKSAEKPVSVGHNNVKYGGWDRKPLSGNSESRDDAFSNIKFSLTEQKFFSKSAQRPLKKQRLADGFNSAENGDASSDSDKEQSLTAYYSGAVALANSPEEKKKRENRSKRFEKGQGHRSEINYFKPKNAGAANLYSKRASALMLSKTYDDGGSRAVEDIDWDALTVKGSCQQIEKRYLRLTSAPDPSTVRPEEMLEKALLMVQNSQKNYLYKCDQLKSIRQDLTVQRIRNQLTVKVYETHARIALEAGDLPEYNQCQSQLKTLYAEGIEGCHMEFAAYNLLCVILHSSKNRDLVSSMSRLTEEAKKDKAVKHALAVRAAVTSGNYVMFFKLYKGAPNLNTCFMDLCVEKMRYKAVSCISRSYRPTVPVSYIAQILGFSVAGEGNDEKEPLGLEECVEWLKAHGACLMTDNNGEMQLDAKASSSSLYIPEPEDAVSHGDANLAVNDFLTRTSL